MKLQPQPRNGTQKVIKTLAKEYESGTWNFRILLRPGLIKEYQQYNITTYMLWPHRRPDGKGKQ